MIEVLVVEDSAVVREFLVHLLSSSPQLHVVGTAGSGEEALQAVERWRPDVITMDINMPGMNGFEATRRIMETYPTPIIIVSGSWDPEEVATSFRAVEAGALAVMPRPFGVGHSEHQATATSLIQTVRLMAEVKVVRRWGRPVRPAAAPVRVASIPTIAEQVQAEVQAVAIGASTGGPLVLRTILSGLPTTFLAPVFIVQHMAAGFMPGFVEWLGQSSALPISIAVHGQEALPGSVYVAPDGYHMQVQRGGRILLTDEPPEHGLRPSVSCLFRSVAQAYGANAVGVLLTGMGKDGAAELKTMRQGGAVTIAQDKESSVVHGMPGEALNLDAVSYVLSPEQIAAALASLVNHNRETR
jgi:two-component system chemotaxis response regulator CheB